MKKNLTLFLLCFIVLKSYVLAQVSDSTSEIKKEITETQKLVKTFNEKLEKILSDSETEDIGTLELYEFKPWVYSTSQYMNDELKLKNARKEYDMNVKKIKKGEQVSAEQPPMFLSIGEPKLKLNIEKVEFNIQEGVIEKIRVTSTSNSNNYIFENNRPIALNNFHKSDLRLFLYDVNDPDRFVRIYDFLHYLGVPGKSFIPDDVDVKLDKDDTSVVVKSSIDLNSNIDVRVYTDFFALLNRKANGIIQTEVRSKIVLNPIPTIYNLFLVNYVQPYVRYSKFDSDFRSVKLNDYSGTLFPSNQERVTLNQQSYLNLGIKLCLMRFKLFNQYLEANYALNYDFVDVESPQDSSIKTANSYSYYFEALLGFSRSKHFGINCAVQVLSQKYLKTEVKFEPRWDSYLIPEFSVFYFPKAEKSNKIFLRFRSFTDILFYNSFSVFQFGYSTKLSITKS